MKKSSRRSRKPRKSMKSPRTSSRKKSQGGGQQGQQNRRHLLSCNLGQIKNSWEAAKQAESDPVMFLLDLNDDGRPGPEDLTAAPMLRFQPPAGDEAVPVQLRR